MTFLMDLFQYVVTTVIRFFPILLLGATLAAFIQVYVDPERMREWLTRRSAISVPATVVFGAFTPFCACGTMAVIVGMLATTMPWAPIMAFLTSSPLMSPTNFVLLYGVVSPSFAVAATVASISVGLASGYITLLIERRSTFLIDQLRFPTAQIKSNAICGCTESIAEASVLMDSDANKAATGSCCGTQSRNDVLSGLAEQRTCVSSNNQKEDTCCTFTEAAGPDSENGSTKHQTALSQSGADRIRTMIQAILQISVVRILPIFIIFTMLGFLVNTLIPSRIFTSLLGTQSLIGVPLATLIGLPLYVSGESAVPLIRSLLEAGVSPGAMLAFMIAGPGTSAAAIAGIGAIMKKRAIALYVGYILGAALLFGYGYDVLLRIMAL